MEHPALRLPLFERQLNSQCRLVLNEFRCHKQAIRGCMIERKFPDIRQSRSQDLPPLYCPTGAIWITSASALKQHGTFYAPEHVFHSMHHISAVDIDDQDDLIMAQAFATLRQAQTATRAP